MKKQMRYMPILLATVGILCSSLSVLASNSEIEQKALTKFLKQDLEESKNGLIHYIFTEDSRYGDISKINGGYYPKMPRVHPYSHGIRGTPFGLELPKEFLQKVPENIRFLLSSKGISEKDINLFFVCQFAAGGGYGSTQDDILFRPHYYADNTAEDNSYDVTQQVSAGIFPIGISKVKLESQPTDSLLDGCIATHGNLQTSPNNFPIKNFKAKEGDFFASIVIVNDNNNKDDEKKKKAAITLHYLPSAKKTERYKDSEGKIQNSDFMKSLNNVKKIEDLLFVEEFKSIVEMEKWDFLKLGGGFDWKLYYNDFKDVFDEFQSILDINSDKEHLKSIENFVTWHFKNPNLGLNVMIESRKDKYGKIGDNFDWKLYYNDFKDVFDGFNDYLNSEAGKSKYNSSMEDFVTKQFQNQGLNAMGEYRKSKYGKL